MSALRFWFLSISREITIATRVVEQLGDCYLFYAYKKGPNLHWGGGGGRGLLHMRIGGDSNLSPPQNWAAVMSSQSIWPQVLNGTAEIWFCLPLYTESDSDSHCYWVLRLFICLKIHKNNCFSYILVLKSATFYKPTNFCEWLSL